MQEHIATVNQYPDYVKFLQIFRTGKPTVFRRGMKVRSNTEWYKKRRFIPLQVFEILFS